MKKTLFKISLLITLSLASVSLNAQDLYLIIGQSNASGRDDNFDFNGADLKTSNVQLLSAGGKFWKAKQPLNRHSNIKKTTSVQGVNFGLEFGKDMYDYNGNTVYLVSNARGGTKVAQWRQGKSYAYFEDTITRVEKAEEQCNCQLKGILWHQGEGDTKSTTLGYTTSYFSSLANLIDELRTELNRDVPFIVGQIYDNAKNTPFNDKLKTVDDNSFSEDDVDWVSSDNLTTVGDDTHFNAASTRELGRRYAAVMQQYISSASSKTSATDELITENNVKVYPNPANETIQISGLKENETSIIYNILGVKVIETKQNNIDISKLKSGFYIVITESGDKVKFLKQ